MTPHDIIEQLRTTSSINSKREILRDNKENELFQLVLTNALDPRVTFGIKKIPEYEYHAPDLSLKEAIEALSKLVHRESTGTDGIAFLKEILGATSEKDAQVIKWIISKDFKAGFGISLINDEMKPFQIYEVPYMGAVSYDEKKIKSLFEKHPYAFSEVKMDGRYLNIISTSTGVFFESRGGNPNPLMGALEIEAKKLRDYFGFDIVINGELMLRGEKDRYKANGIISSYISIAQKQFDGKDISKEARKFRDSNGVTLANVNDSLTLVAWDYIPLSDYRKKCSETSRSQRLMLLEDAIKETSSFEIIEYRVVRNKAEAVEHFQDMLHRGEEGTILKGSNGEWADGKPSHQIKMKISIDLDLRIESFNYGTPGTKNENVISSLNVTSECGNLRTSPGGITEKDMLFITENMDSLNGKLVEIKCSGLSRDSDGNWSCLHPVFKLIRDDKEHGDTLESAIAIENSAKGLE